MWVESKRERSVVKPLLKRYRVQHGRGTEGFGYVSVNADGYVSEVFRGTEEKDLIAALDNENATSLLLHHRFPTSLPNYKGATHPLVIKDDRFKYDYYIVHNGVIRNYKGMYEDYKKAGIKFLTELAETKVHRFVNTGESYELDSQLDINDSEAFAYDLVHFIEGKQHIIKSTGTASFIGLQCEKDGRVVNLIYGHNNGNPLVKEEDKTLFVLKSVGQGNDVDTDLIHFRNWSTGEITTMKATGLSYGGYSSGKKNAGFQSGERKEERGGVKESDKKQVKSLLPSQLPKAPDELDSFLTRLLPSGVGFSRISTHEERINYEEPQPKDFADFEADELSHVDFEELFPISQLEDEITAADASGSMDAGVMRQLRDDLKEDIETENEAIDEVNGARDMLRSCAKLYLGKRSNLEELETAKSLFNEAEEKLKKATRNRQATQAELEAYVGFGGAGGRDDESDGRLPL